MPIIIKKTDFTNAELFSIEMPLRKKKAEEEGTEYRGQDINILTKDGSGAEPTVQWGCGVVGKCRLTQRDGKSTLRVSLSKEEYDSFLGLQESIIDVISKSGKNFGIDVEEDEFIGKKIVNEMDGTYSLSMKIKPQTKFYSKDRTPMIAEDGVSYLDSYGIDYGNPGLLKLSEPNTECSIFFQPNGAYVINSICHLSVLASQIRIVSSGAKFEKVPYEDQLVDVTADTEDKENWNVTYTGAIDTDKISISRRVEAMGAKLKKLNVYYESKGVNKFPVFQTDFGFTYGIENNSKEDEFKKVIKIYNSSSSDEHLESRESLDGVFKKISDFMYDAEIYKATLGKKPRKETIKGGVAKGYESKTTKRLTNVFSGSMNTFAWQEKSISKDGEEVFFDKIKLTIPTDAEGLPTVPVFDEDGCKVEPERLMDSDYTKTIMVRAIYQINGIWISILGYGLLTTVKQLHVRSRRSSGEGSVSQPTASSYITFDDDLPFEFNEADEVVEVCC